MGPLDELREGGRKKKEKKSDGWGLVSWGLVAYDVVKSQSTYSNLLIFYSLSFGAYSAAMSLGSSTNPTFGGLHRVYIKSYIIYYMNAYPA